MREEFKEGDKVKVLPDCCVDENLIGQQGVVVAINNPYGKVIDHVIVDFGEGKWDSFDPGVLEKV